MGIKGYLQIFLLFMGLVLIAALETCQEDDFQCTDQQRCIGKAFVCDDFPNCLDHSDEDPEFCETWEYEDPAYEDGGGGWFGAFGDYDDDEDLDSSDGENMSLGEDSFPGSDSEDEDADPFQSQFEEDEETSTEKCSLQQCIPTGPVYFESDMEYHYSYEMVSETQAMRQTDNQTSSMAVTCDVIIQTLSACEMVLKIENVVSKFSTPGSQGKVTSEDPNDEFLRSIEKERLRFSMFGEVSTVCPSAEEDPRALNFKRGIISMLQNTMPVLHLSHTQVERDIGGECEVNYQFEGSNGVNVVVSKTRNVHSCKGRSELSSNIRGVPYDFPMASDPLPIVETTSQCKQEISFGAIREASCSEDYVLTPFNTDQGGIRSSIEQRLSFKSDNDVFAKWPRFSRRTNLVFDHEAVLRYEVNSDIRDQEPIEIVEEILDKIVGTEQDEMEVEYPANLFKQLVINLHHLSVDQLERVNQRQWRGKDRQSFHDAIGLIGTASSLRFMAKEMPSLSDASVIKTWINSLSTLQSPSAEVLSVLPEIMDAASDHGEALLAAGALLNTYCLRHPGCSSHAEVINILSTFRSYINSECSSKSTPQKMELLMSLRGIGNAGLAADERTIDALNRCITADRNDPEVKGTAIESFRRVSCNVSRSALEMTFTDEDKDSELRILAYLGLMRCADYSTLHLVENMLQNEQVNQVGSFVWTHLKNLQETGAPSKIEVESLLSNRFFEEKFVSDFRKYSKNVEWSGFYDPLNVGGSVESNLIFSQHSYIPRITNFNLTADLFGRSFNFLEAGIRLEGFEKAIEQYLRDGDEPAAKSQKIKNRSINQLARASPKAKEYRAAEPELSFHMKTFGNDVQFHHQTGMNEIASKINDFNLDSLMNMLKTEQEVKFEKSFMPLHSWYQLATSSGFPLRISMDGFASTDVSASIKMDLMSILSGKVMLKGHLKPTLSLDVQAAMVLDGYSSTTGIELDASFFTSTIVDGRIEIDGKNEVSIDVNLPQEKVTVYEASTKLVMVHGHSNLDSSGDLSKHEEVSNDDVPVSGSQKCMSLEKMYGIMACRFTSYRDLEEPISLQRIILNGPIQDKITLSKEDSQLTSYKFRYRWTNNDEKLELQLLYDTPGSEINRNHEIRLTLTSGWSDIEMVYHSPRLSLDVLGKLILTENEKRLNLALSMDGDRVSTVDAKYKLFEKSGQQYIVPSLTITWRGTKMFLVKGSVDVQDRNRSGGGGLIHYTISLSFEVDGTGFGSQKGSGTMAGYVTNTDNDWNVNLDANYALYGSSRREELKLEYSKVMQKESEDDHLAKVKMVRTWRGFSTQFPYINSKVKWASKSFPGSIENGIQGSFGRDFENPLHQVDLYHNLMFYGGSEQTTFNSTIAIKYPKKNLDIVIGGDLYQDRRDYRVGFVMQYATDQAIRSLFYWTRTMESLLNTEADFFFRVPSWIDFRMNAKMEQQKFNVFQFDIEASLSASQRVELTGYYTNLSSRLEEVHMLEMTFKTPSGNLIYSNSTLLSSLSQTVLSSQIKLMDGSKYKLRVAYINQIDDFETHQHKIEIDLNLLKMHYYWHTDISFGKYITVSNDIHIDGIRDVNFWMQVLSENNKLASVEAKVYWDYNRDPHKSAKFKIILGDSSVDLIGVISILGNEYKGTWRSVKDWQTIDHQRLLWHHSHSGELLWLDNNRDSHKISFGMNFNLSRSDQAELTATAYLNTPLDSWKNNVVNLKYFRDENHIEASLNSKWHHEESLNLNFKAGLKRVEFGMEAECKVEILSFINEKSISVNTGALFTRAKGLVKGKLFLQWDKDEVQFLVEMVNNSGPRDIKAFGMAKVLTTLEGYKVISAVVDVYGTFQSFILHGSAKWDEILYDLKCKGELHSATDYLKAEMQLVTPQFGPDTASTQIRIYHDYQTREEKLSVTGHWLSREFSLKGRVSTQEGDFKAELNLDVPFKKLSQASLVIGHSTKEFYKSEIWAKWNGTKEVGAGVTSRMNSLTDFLLSLTVRTPFDKYKELRAELRNFFQVSPSVLVYSRVFGQFDEKKYGLGGRYEQGESPKLRVGLELYYPSHDLNEVMFDIADNSSATNMRYNFELKHGIEKQITISTDFKRMEDSVDFSFTSGITLPGLLGSDLNKVDLEGRTKVVWSPSNTDLELRLAATTHHETHKVFLKGLFTSEHSGSVEGNLALPFENMSDLEYSVKFLRPGYHDDGYLNVRVTSGRIPVLSFDFNGRPKQLSITFQTPFENYSNGHFQYQLVSEDVVRSRVTGEASVEDHHITFQGSIYINSDHYVTMMELSAETPYVGFKDVTVTLEGEPESGGFRNILRVTADSASYEGDVFSRFTSPDDWKLNSVIKRKSVEGEKSYSSEISYRSRHGEPLTFSARIEGLFDKGIGASVTFQTATRPYALTVEWDAPAISGSVTLTLEHFENRKIVGGAALRLKPPGAPFETYELKTSLQNRSTRDEVDLALLVEISSTNQRWNYILVDGSLKQVTSTPGKLQVYLVWPEMEPVNFTALATYSRNPSLDLRTSVSLNLTSSQYGFIGEVQGDQLQSDGTEGLSLKGGIWWQREPGSEIMKIKLESLTNFTPNGFVVKNVLHLPMVPNVELSKVNVTYRKENKNNTLRVTVEAANTLTTFDGFLLPEGSSAFNGRAVLTSSKFRAGNPVTLYFRQSYIEDGFKSEYDLTWPVAEQNSSTYKMETLNATFEQKRSAQGFQGKLQLTSPLTKGKPVSITYSFQIPKHADVIIKFGITYDLIKFEVTANRVMVRTATQQIKKTSLDVYNILWPFGVAYIRTLTLVPTEENEDSDKLIIYDLEETDRRLSLNFSRKINNEGGRIGVTGVFFERELELSAGYKSLDRNSGADLLLLWSKEEKIHCQVDWKDKSKTPGEKNYLIVAKISHPVRTLLLETVYMGTDASFAADVTLNTDLDDPRAFPLKALINVERPTVRGNQNHLVGRAKVSHPSLESDISLSMEFQRTYLHPLLFNFLLKYSSSSDKDLAVKADVMRNDAQHQFSDVFEVIHYASNLHAKADGVLKYGQSIYSFEQDFFYMDAEGTEFSSKVDGGLNLDANTLHTSIKSSSGTLDLNLKMFEKEDGLWEIQTTSGVIFPRHTSLQLHPKQPIFILTVDNKKSDQDEEQATHIENLEYPTYSAEKVVIEGGLQDRRFAHFSMKHLPPPPPRYDARNNSSQTWISDVDFMFRLNNSKLLFSYLNWRKPMEEEIKNQLTELMGMKSDVKEWLKNAAVKAGKETIGRAKPILADIKMSVVPLIAHFKNESRAFKSDLRLLFQRTKLTKIELNTKASIDYIIKNLVNTIKEIGFVKRLKEKLSKGTLREQIAKWVEKLKSWFTTSDGNQLTLAELIKETKRMASDFAAAYDKAAKNWYLAFRNTVEKFKMRLIDWLKTKWHNLYYSYKPHILRTLDHIEAASYSIVSNVWATMNHLGANFRSHSFVQTLEDLYQGFKLKYNEMLQRSLKGNLEVIFSYIGTSIRRGFNLFLSRVVPFVGDWKREIEDAWVQVSSFGAVQTFIDFGSNIIKTVRWSINKIDFSECFINSVAFGLEHGYTILSQTAMEAYSRNMEAKTDFIWSTELGKIKLVQKLPFVWNHFNEKPMWDNMMKIPYFSTPQRTLFPAFRFSVLDVWYKYFNLNFDPSTWIPPFPATGYVVGENNLLTFDGRLLNFKGSCEHVLTVDLVNQKWAVTIHYNRFTPKTIKIYVDGKVVEFSKTFKAKVNNRLSTLPLALDTAFVWRTVGALHLRQEDGIQVTWNLAHDVVSIRMPRSAFLHSAGLLGTNNNEPIDDLTLPDGTRWKNSDHLKEFFDSWLVEDFDACLSVETLQPPEPAAVTSSICDELFVDKSSPFRYCFYQVNPKPFHTMCLNSYQGNVKETSPSAMAYKESCLENAVPVKLPVDYIRCEYTNASSGEVKKLTEGEMVTLRKNEVERSVNVVLLVELKQCNKAKMQPKSVQRFITMFNEGLLQEGVEYTRFAMVTFGGSGLSRDPFVVSSGEEMFTSAKNIAKYVENLDFSNHADNDTARNGSFGAITFASNLPFKSPGKVVFALFPCTPCEEPRGYGFTTMQHILLNNAATLYVFKSDYFGIEKQSIRKKVIGFDAEKAYMLKDFKRNKMGDKTLKSHVRLPKQELSLCLPLATEMKGMVFSSEFLMESKKKTERLGIVAGRKAGQRLAEDEHDQRCLCLSTQEVTPLLRCNQWTNGDFTVLEKYGLDLAPKSAHFEDLADDTRPDFY